MDTIPIVRASSLPPIAGELDRLGVPLHRRLERVGLPAEVLGRPESLIPERAVWALLDDVRREESIADIGFRIGASHHVTDIEGLGELLSGHPTLLKTIQVFCSHLRSYANCWDYWIEPFGDDLRLCRKGSPIDVGRWPVEQYVVSYLVDLVRMAQPDWFPEEIWLQAEVELSNSERRWLRESRIHFASPVTAIAVPETLLARRPRGRTSGASDDSVGAPLSRDLGATLRALLLTYLPEERTRLEDIGAAVGLHPRTLQRRLAREGATFQRILEEVRLEMACSRLSATDQPIADIAFEVGYQRVAALSRSFHRWTGVSPTAYRQANRAQVS